MAQERDNQRRQLAALTGLCLAYAAIVAIPFPIAKSICSPCNEIASNEMTRSGPTVAEIERNAFNPDSVELQIGVSYSTVVRRVGPPDGIHYDKQKGVYEAIYNRSDDIFVLMFMNENGQLRLLDYTMAPRDW
jgi:hypothetical protein